jgi:hypothetical protein
LGANGTHRRATSSISWSTIEEVASCHTVTNERKTNQQVNRAILGQRLKTRAVEATRPTSLSIFIAGIPASIQNRLGTRKNRSIR